LAIIFCKYNKYQENKRFCAGQNIVKKLFLRKNNEKKKKLLQSEKK